MAASAAWQCTVCGAILQTTSEFLNHDCTGALSPELPLDSGPMVSYHENQLVEKVAEVTTSNVLERWEDSHVKLLISCYKEYKHLFGKGKSTKKEIFGKIAFSFNKQAPNSLVTGEQCMRKWTKLETKLKEVEDHNSKSGNDKKSMKFQDMMVDCIGEKKNVKPEVIMESTGEDVGSLSDNSAGGDDTESSGKSVVKQRVKRKHRSHSSAAEMLTFLSSYSEKREKNEEEKLKLLKEMKEERNQFLGQLLEIMKKSKS
ncbi:uncharacterized protein [Montipora capricornis]|uniref:uncharacterized protein n=1 Tax=Montipora capricornis TaxID=246305 RepID=UPI0035F18BD6